MSRVATYCRVVGFSASVQPLIGRESCSPCSAVGSFDMLSQWPIKLELCRAGSFCNVPRTGVFSYFSVSCSCLLLSLRSCEWRKYLSHTTLICSYLCRVCHDMEMLAYISTLSVMRPLMLFATIRTITIASGHALMG